jgi:hypothetical protein
MAYLGPVHKQGLYRFNNKVGCFDARRKIKGTLDSPKFAAQAAAQHGLVVGLDLDLHDVGPSASG